MAIFGGKVFWGAVPDEEGDFIVTVLFSHNTIVCHSGKYIGKRLKYQET